MTVRELLFALLLLGSWAYVGWFAIRAAGHLGGFTGWGVLALWGFATLAFLAQQIAPGSVEAFLAMPVMAR